MCGRFGRCANPRVALDPEDERLEDADVIVALGDDEVDEDLDEVGVGCGADEEVEVGGRRDHFFHRTLQTNQFVCPQLTKK